MRSAVAFPMPRLEPVTTATLPSSRMHRSATRRGGRPAQALEDETDLLALVSRQVTEWRPHRSRGMTEELHGDLHDSHLEAPPALAEVVERSDDTLVELCEPAVVRGTGETVELERGLGPEARERRGEALRPRREVRTDHVVARAVAPRRARALRRDARTETDARDDRDPADGRLDGRAHDRGALVRREAEQLAGAARRDERVHAAAREPARVRVDRPQVDRAVVGVRRDREREHASKERSQVSRGRRGENPRHRRTRTTMFVGFTKRSAASSRMRLVAMYTTAIASICWLGRMPGAKAA